MSCQKVVNVLAVASFAISGAIAVSGVYVYVNRDSIIDGVKSLQGSPWGYHPVPLHPYLFHHQGYSSFVASCAALLISVQSTGLYS